jgi:16S rRNA (guanine527-N7)-methyltransferase
MNANDILAAAQAVSVALSPQQSDALLTYRNLLVEWNARFNLTALTDDASILSLHFADSLTLVPMIRALGSEAAATLLDVGTGGGFPGIPLKIALPRLTVTVMDGTTKKVQFCTEVIRTLKLNNATALHGRAEEAAHQPAHREYYDLVVARAVAPMPTLVEYLLPFAKVGGHVIAMKGSDARAETEQATQAIQTLGGTVEQIEDAALPGRADKRALILIRKVRPTPKLYPRQGGAPRNNPLK